MQIGLNTIVRAGAIATLLILFGWGRTETSWAEKVKEPPGQLQLNNDKASVPGIAAASSAETEQVLARLRGNFPGKPDDEIIQVLRGYISEGDSAEGGGVTWFARRLERAKKQKEAADVVLKSGGMIHYRYEFDKSGNYIFGSHPKPAVPATLLRLLGRDFFSYVFSAGIHSDDTLQYLASLPNVRKLQAVGKKVTDIGLACISKSTKLDTLDAFDSQFTDDGLANLRNLRHLTSLNLKGTQITDRGIEHVCRLKELRLLSVDTTAITDVGLKRLAVLTGLQSLSIGNTSISDDGLEHLKSLTELKALYIDHTNIGDPGLSHLKGLCQLERLFLWNTNVSDAGLKNLKGMTKMKLLLLDGTKVTGSGFKHLKGLPLLEQLWCEFDDISDDGLVALGELHQLRLLRLSGVSEQNIKKLQQSLPKCKIDH